MRETKGIIHNLGLMTVGQILAQLLNVWALVFLAGYLGKHWFGVIQIGTAFMAYALITAEWGLMSLGIKEISRLNKMDAIFSYACQHTGMLGVQSVVVLLLGLLLLPRLPFYSQDHFVFLIYLTAVIPQVFTQSWIAIGLERMTSVGLLKTSLSLIYALIILVFLKPLAGLSDVPVHRWVPVIYLLAVCLSNLVVMIPVSRWFNRFVLPSLPSAVEAKRRWKATAPIGSNIVVLRVLYNIDIIILGILVAPEVAGWYAAASRLIFLLIVAIEVLWLALLPKLARQFKTSRTEFLRTFNLYLGFVTTGLLPVAIGGVLVGKPLIAFIYKNKFPEAGPVIQVLAVSYTLLSLAMFIGNSMVAEDKQHRYFPPLVLCSAIALAATSMLIPRFGGMGASWGMLAAHSVLFFVLAFMYRHNFSRHYLALLVKLVPAVCGLAAVVMVTSSWQVGVRIGLGGIAYLVLASYPVLQLFRHSAGTTDAGLSDS